MTDIDVEKLFVFFPIGLLILAALFVLLVLVTYGKQQK